MLKKGLGITDTINFFGGFRADATQPKKDQPKNQWMNGSIQNIGGFFLKNAGKEMHERDP